ARIHLQDGLPRVDRAIDLRALLRRPRELDGEPELLVHRPRATLRVIEHLHEAWVVLTVELAVELEHPWMRGFEPPNALEVGLGLLRRVADAPVHHRELKEDALLRLEL